MSDQNCDIVAPVCKRKFSRDKYTHSLMLRKKLTEKHKVLTK